MACGCSKRRDRGATPAPAYAVPSPTPVVEEEGPWLVEYEDGHVIEFTRKIDALTAVALANSPAKLVESRNTPASP